MNKLDAEMKRALAAAEFSKHIETTGIEPASSPPEELREWVRTELARWKKVVRDAGLGSQLTPVSWITRTAAVPGVRKVYDG